MDYKKAITGMINEIQSEKIASIVGAQEMSDKIDNEDILKTAYKFLIYLFLKEE